MFGMESARKSESAQTVSEPNRFVVLIVFGLCLVALLIALKVATGQSPANISTRQVLIQKK
jgi:hypothetical protein